MKSSLLKLATFVALLAAPLAARAQTAEAPFFASTAALGGVVVTDTWTGLTAANHPGYPTFPGTGAWPAPIAPNEASVSGAEFDKVSGAGYPASGSVYPFGSGVFSVSVETALADLATVVFQVNYQDPGAAITGLSLSFDGGAQTLAADASFSVVNGASLAAVYQWDLSSFGGTIDSFVITWTQPAHGAIQGLQLTQGTVYQNLAAVPEPSAFAAIAAVAVLGFASSRRRRVA